MLTFGAYISADKHIVFSIIYTWLFKPKKKMSTFTDAESFKPPQHVGLSQMSADKNFYQLNNFKDAEMTWKSQHMEALMDRTQTV